MILNYPKFCEWLTLKGYSAATVKTMLKQAVTFIAWAERENIPDPAAVSYGDLLSYVQSCQGRGVSQKTIAHYISDIRKFYSFLISEGMLKENPAAFITTRGIKRQVYHRILSTSELQQLHRQYPVGMPHEPGKPIPPQERNVLSRRRNKVIVSLLVSQGLRVEEIKALRVQDLQLREGRIIVHHQRRTAERVLELESCQVVELMDYLGEVRKAFVAASGPSDRLFLQWKQGAHFYSVTGMMLEHLRKINASVKNLDQIRASVITHWVKTYNLRRAQYMAGHRYVSTTEAYKQQVLDELQNDVKKFHPLG
jgi:site-specific recombinase XerD